LAVRISIERRPEAWRQWERFRREFERLVGWTAADARLRTSEAYELAVDVCLRIWETGR
jgi:hypothetical protein